jgi:hypothetical protein
MSLEKIAAALVLVACLGVWGHMLLTPERRRRLLAGPRRLWRGWRHRRDARREASDAIERARRKPGVEPEGNVYRPKSFDRSRGDDETLH